jgi:excisionase family DNA binding protein
MIRREVGALRDSMKQLLSPADVAARLGLSRPHVYTLAAAGKIRSIKFGRAVRFDPKDVERFIRDHRRGGIPPPA